MSQNQSLNSPLNYPLRYLFDRTQPSYSGLESGSRCRRPDWQLNLGFSIPETLNPRLCQHFSWSPGPSQASLNLLVGRRSQGDWWLYFACIGSIPLSLLEQLCKNHVAAVCGWLHLLQALVQSNVLLCWKTQWLLLNVYFLHFLN